MTNIDTQYYDFINIYTAYCLHCFGDSLKNEFGKQKQAFILGNVLL